MNFKTITLCAITALSIGFSTSPLLAMDNNVKADATMDTTTSVAVSKQTIISDSPAPEAAAESGEPQISTTVTNTYEQNNVSDDAIVVDLSAYDVNEDGKYSMVEVGERLFYDFDTDGNEVIDNIEWDNEIFKTITPMERETFTYIDYDSDGWVEESSYTYETFYEASGLIKFDKNKSGLSASEFIGTSFQEIDDNDSGTVDLEEWQEVYMGARAKHNEPENYNQ